jgi:hypothetical protein
METNINLYNLSQEGKQYLLKSSLIGNRLRLSCKSQANQKIKFTREFTMDELKTLDKIFSPITTPFEALQYFDTMMKNQKVSVSESFDVINIKFYLKSEEDSYQTEIPLSEEFYTSTTTDENVTTNFDLNAFQNLDNVNADTGFNTYDANINTQTENVNVDITYGTPEIINTTSYENVSSDNYLQNIEASATTMNDVVVDTGIDLNNYTNYNTTEVQDITNQYQENTDINTNTNITDYNTYNYNEYQSTSEPVNIPQENNQQIYETSNLDQYNQYTTTENVQQETYNTVPFITPVEDTSLNQYIQNTATTTTTTTNTTIPDDRINKLEGDTNILKSEQQDLQSQIKKLNEQLNEYQTKISLMQNSQSNDEIQALRKENQLIKQQLQELDSLRREVEETRYLKAQLSELDPLKQKAAEADSLRDQLNELNLLKQRVNELNNARNQQLNQLQQINNLKKEFDQINSLKQQLNELNNMRKKSLEDNELKDRINELENVKTRYEQELHILRESQRKSQEFNKLRYSTGMDSKQLLFEEKPMQFAVKGDIIHSSRELELLTRKINKSNRKLTLNLLYKARVDSDRASAFHNKCDGARSTLVLVETDKGKRFGGYTSRTWSGDCIEKKDDEAFLFSLDKMMTYDIIPGEEAIGCYPKYGPIFMGCQIRIFDNAFAKGGTTFEKGLNYYTQEDFELTGGEREFNVREIEVYEVIPS